jgi:hypothetical protein
MAIINNVNEVLHRIRVKLYPNSLPHVEGAYIARTDNEVSLTVEEVCAALKNRGGFTGNYEDLLGITSDSFLTRPPISSVRFRGQHRLLFDTPQRGRHL